MTTDKGIKLDTGKPRLDLVLGDFCNALWEVGKVGTFGANKYTDRGWQEVDNGIERYLSAMLRHYFKFKSGEEYDKESLLLHLSHLAWNALAVLELYSRYKTAREEAISIDDTIKDKDFKGLSLLDKNNIDEVLDKII